MRSLLHKEFKVKRIITLVAASVAAIFMGLGTSHTASAHAVIPLGQYRVAIGWQFEPTGGSDTYAGTTNAIQVFVDAPIPANDIGNPVGDLNSDCTKPDFTVTVTVGSTTSGAYCPGPVYDADTARGRQDEYDAPITPTAVGTYTFHIKGNIHGVPIDKTIQSGPTTFDSVAESTSSDFPVSVPPVSALSTKIDAVDGRTTNAQNSATSAQNSATTGLIVGIAGAALALISGVVALAALRKAARKT
jgi:hypothetical protein